MSQIETIRIQPENAIPTKLNPRDDPWYNPDDMLEVSNLSVRFGRNHALLDVSCRARPGSIVALVGPNAAGKTTLLRAIARLINKTSVSGTVSGAGTIAYCPDTGTGFFDLTVAENIELLMLALEWNATDRAARRSALVRLVSTEPVGSSLLDTLSLGLRRRVDIALTVCKPAAVYLFDEPYNGLDATWIRTFSGLLTELSASGRTCIVASHSIDLLLPVASSLWEIDKGRLIQEIHKSPGAIAADSLETLRTESHAGARLPWLTTGL